MRQPFEEKYNQVKRSLTDLKVRYNELSRMYNTLSKSQNELYYQVQVASNALIAAGYRRLDDRTWTKEPFVLEDIDEQ